jgi:site-specific recombinase XerD
MPESVCTPHHRPAGSSRFEGAALPTIEAVVVAYLAERQQLLKAKIVTEKRLDNERRYLVNFAKMFGELPCGRVAASSVVAQWLTANPRWIAADTKRDAVNCLCQCFAWAADEDGGDMIERKLFKRVKLRSFVPRIEPREPVYTPQVLAILRAARTHCRGHREARDSFRFAVLFLQQTGARPCEMRCVCWEHVDWKNGVVTLPPELSKTGKRTGKPRLIVLTRRMMRLIRAAWQARKSPASGPIFLNARGRPIRVEAFCDLFKRVREAVGLPKECTPAGIRHGVAVRWISAGMSNKRAADLLGHTTSTMVDSVYDRHLSVNRLVKSLRGSIEPPRVEVKPRTSPASTRDNPASAEEFQVRIDFVKPFLAAGLPWKRMVQRLVEKFGILPDAAEVVLVRARREMGMA